MKLFFSATALLCCFCGSVRAQLNGLNASILTPPNVSSLFQADKIPVSLFTGAPDIRVPVYNLKVENFENPIYLSYNARGVQPNTHAGWSGTGWTLHAEPMITRKVNALPDELYIYDQSSVNSDGKIGWYYAANRNLLSNSSWATPSNLLKYVGGSAYDATGQGGHSGSVFTDSAPDEFDFNINGSSGAFFLGEDGIWKVRSADAKTMKITENYGTVTYRAFASSSITVKAFIGFTITMEDGMQYIFGGDANSIDFNRMGTLNMSGNNPNIFAMAWHLKKVILPSKRQVTFDYIRNGVQLVYNPSSYATYYGISISSQPSWYLFWERVGLSSSRSSFYGHIINLSIMDPVYLSAINFPAGKLVFNSSLSNEADKRDDPYTSINCFASSEVSNGAPVAYNVIKTYPDLVNNFREPNYAQWRKLDNIELDNMASAKIRTWSLTYTQDANTRMFLKNVQETNFYKNATGESLPPFIFNYNQTALPPYCTEHVDHWGFYNGQKPFPSNPGNGTFPVAAFQTDYFNFREPDATAMLAGILTSLKYPSGGTATFEYEPNQYHKVVGGFPAAVTSLSGVQALTGGGLRVRKITQTDDVTGYGRIYQYDYVNDLAAGVPSGVLGMPKPVYFENDQTVSYQEHLGGLLSSRQYANSSTYSMWTTNPVFPSQNDDGNIVTYTTVFERQYANGAFNGSKKTIFSNHDNGNGVDVNGFLNNTADGGIFITPGDQQLFHYSDRAFERGMVLSELYSNAAGQPVKLVQNTYNDDANRFNSYVKGIYSTNRLEVTVAHTGDQDIRVEENFLRTSAVRFFTFYPFLKRTVVSDYPSVAGLAPKVTTTDYLYDSTNGTKNLIRKTDYNSDGDKIITNITYAGDYSQTASDDFTLGIKKLAGMGAVGLPVEKYVQRSAADGSNTRTVSASLNIYDSSFPFPKQVYKADFLSPSTTFSKATNPSGLVKDGAYRADVMAEYNSVSGNIAREQRDRGNSKVYVFGYQSLFPVAVITNATLADIQTVMSQHGFSQTDLDNAANLTDAQVRAFTNYFRTDLPNAMVKTYTYTPAIGITSETDVKGMTTYYEYDSFGRLRLVRDKDMNIVKQMSYHYKQ